MQTAETEQSTGKVKVTGTMDANKLVDYVYRSTRKQAKIVPQPEPEPEKKEGEEAKTEEKKEEEKPAEEEKKEEGDGSGENKSENNKEGGGEQMEVMNMEDEGMKRMMYYYYQPLYMVERIPPPQLFSDENPNACCIS